MSNTLFAWDNIVLTGALSAPSEASNLGTINLKTEVGSPSVAWQTVTGITGPPGAVLTITPTQPNRIWRVFGVFRTNLTQYATVTATIYDNNVAVWSGQALGPTPGYGQCIIVVPQDYTGDYATISISDTTNPDGFINVPLVFAGPAWLPMTGIAYDSTEGDDPKLDETVSRGGQEYPVLRFDQRRFEASLMGIRDSEMGGYVRPLRRIAARGNTILFVPDIASDKMDQEAVYGRLYPTADVGYPYAAADRRSWRVRVLERL